MNRKNESGQSAVLIAIFFMALVSMAALIIDGGSLYLNRRNAQTAADAAAMAGAHEKCVNHGTLQDIEDIATEYAVAQNGATQVESVTVNDDGQVVVQTRLETPSLFSVVLGFENNTAHAQASAGCFPPGASKYVLPIAWTCRPPVGGSNETCVLHEIPRPIFETLMTFFDFDIEGHDLDPLPHLLNEGDGENYQSYIDLETGDGIMTYVLMDSNDFDPLVDCEELNPFGVINCDFDEDGILDVEGGANRGWLLLDGTGASDLVDIMFNGFQHPITLPQWFPGKNGVSNNVFIKAQEIKFNISLVPVFNAVCSDTQKENIPIDCPTEYEPGDLISGGEGEQTYYRVAGVSAFVVTCVSKGNAEPCPGKTYANVDHNTSTIEGYFISGYNAGDDIDPFGFDLGVYIITLTE